MCPQGFMNKYELICVLNQAIENDDIKQIDEMVKLIKELINKKLGVENEI
jgi:ribosomal protein S6